MWRYIKVVPRAVRHQWNSPLRPVPQSVNCEDEHEEAKKVVLVRKEYFAKSRSYLEVNPWAGNHKQNDEESKEADQAWTLPNCQHGLLEAFGWGGAIVLGMQLSKIYDLRSKNERRCARWDNEDLSALHWLHHIAAASQAVPSTSLALHSPTVARSIKSNPTNIASHREDRQSEELDYDSLLDIEVESVKLERSHLPRDSIQITHDDSTSKSQQEDGVLETADDVSLKDAVAEWCKMSSRCISNIHHQLAFSALQKGATHEAFKQWQRACHQGDAKSHFNLALCYELGKGVVQDLNKAVEHYAIASAGGHHIAMYNLAIYYLEGRGGVERNEEVAISLLERAAAEGLKEAQTNLGVLITERNGDWQRATELFTLAAQKGDASAQWYLGMCHENGWGVQIDHDRAVELYRSAAAFGHGPALHALGLYTERGYGGLKSDQHAACDLYRQAVAAGHDAAIVDQRRLTMQINTALFESDILPARTETVSHGARKCKSSPSLSHSFSMYIRDNLLDFGLENMDLLNTPHYSKQGITFHIGTDLPDATTVPDPGGGFQLGKGHFGGDIVRADSANSFKSHKGSNTSALLEMEEHQMEMRMVLCS